MKTEKQKILNLLKNTYCRLKGSKIEGVGVFAVRNIPKGKNPFLGVINQPWHKLNIKELERKLDKEVLKLVDDFCVIEKNGEVYIPKTGFNGIDVSFFVNNSKKPNLKIQGNGKNEALNFITARPIKKGEELTVSYSTYDEKYK